jgi:peptide-methionine (S)-S-oxide reductase
MDGVVRTRVGYAGGRKQNPTYHDLGDQAETLQVHFDPARTSYRDLLDVYWAGFRPKHKSWGDQYRNAIFVEDEEQRREAEDYKQQLEASSGDRLQVSIEPAGRFWSAEDYHQKYYLRGDRDLMREFRAMYPDEQGFVDSTAAARVNGFLGGYGDPRADLDRLGLSIEGQHRVVEASARRVRFTCAG